MAPDALGHEGSEGPKADYLSTPPEHEMESRSLTADPRQRRKLGYGQIDELTARIAELEQESAEREALRRQAVQALALTRRRFASALEDGAAREDRDQIDAELGSLRDRLAVVELQLSETHALLATANNELKGAAAKDEQVATRLDAVTAESRELSDRLSAEIDKKSALEEQLAASESWNFRLAGDRRAAEDELAKAKKALGRERKSRELAAQEVRQAKSAVAKLEKALRANIDARDEVSAQRADAYNELAALTRLLRSSELAAQGLAARYDWLVQVTRTLLPPIRWWFHFTPAYWQRRSRQRRLAALQLFDAQAYLERNPDVRGSGQDPLQHYLLHGIAEGRHR